ncbi:5-methylcytosine-specific restriction endonuclease McrA [Cryobacterium sp. MP_3.1]|uniref:HNH endonuclease n=1 Tax=Cryobacterium sp. MP_3.1 TaxID=3071711 RepID=UPI002DFB91F0|nr:5-methylcytosine-specific restriction endonuclease McrA [Cryobacterium sp. MP_3.1]
MAAAHTGVAKNAGRSTRRWKAIRLEFRAKCEREQAKCWLCSPGAIDYAIKDTSDDAVWEPDHIYPVSTHPERAEDPANLRASHRGCNRRRGNKWTPPSLGVLSREWFASD